MSTPTTGDEYIARYPGYCRACDGWGGDFYDYSPAPGPGSIQMADPCPHCVEKGRCPRCGAQSYALGWLFDSETGRIFADGLYDDHGQPAPCVVCGWKDGDDGRPPTEAELRAEADAWESETRDAEAFALWASKDGTP